MDNRFFSVSFHYSDVSFEAEMESNAGSGTDYPEYAGSYEIVPKVTDQTFDTAYKVMTDNLTVTAVPYYQTSNISGDTVYIASEV